MSPETAALRIEEAFTRAGRLIEGSSAALDSRRVALRPRHFWSPHPFVSARVNQSVAGSNVHLRLAIQPAWWALISAAFACSLFVASLSYILREVFLGEIIVIAGLLAVLTVAISAVARAARIGTCAVADVPPN